MSPTRAVGGGPREVVARGLEEASRVLEGLRVPVPPVAGKLLRPLVAWASVPSAERPTVDVRFWLGALAVQTAHEASLLHDDVLDEAETRRDRPTLAARRGVGAALVTGDHWLTAAYRAAVMTESSDFVALFAEAVERTVAGEVDQGRAAGRALAPHEYERIVRAKSGELFGAAAALHPSLVGASADGLRELGLRLGALYQRVDDLLDYCPSTARGKPALQDWRQGKWTWVLGEAGVEDVAGDVDPVLRLLRGDGSASSPLARCLDRLRDEADSLREAHRARTGDDHILPGIVQGWLATAERAVAARLGQGSGGGGRAATGTAEGSGPDGAAGTPAGTGSELEAALVARARSLGGPDEWPALFGRHARTFHFASRLFPRCAARAVSEVYAFCRFTDDLGDEAGGDPPERVVARLECWLALARRARELGDTGVPLLDVPMGRMAEAGVPFGYVEGLVEGVVSDAGTVRIDSLEELELYTWRVAGVVGGWMTRLFGVHDPDVLARAYRLGHAMQLTNILRDVGEDWRMGRLYLPGDLRARHGVDEAMIARVAAGSGPVPAEYRALIEDLMDRADRAYDEALQALPALPAWYGRPVAVAARAYQAIHDRIRANGYDNGTLRAHTTRVGKLRAGVAGLLEMRPSSPPIRREAPA